MAHHEAKVSSKGQLTIPAPVRDFFDLQTGDTVDFFVDRRTRSVRMRARNRPIAGLSGILNKYIDPNAEPVTLEQRERLRGRGRRPHHESVWGVAGVPELETA